MKQLMIILVLIMLGCQDLTYNLSDPVKLHWISKGQQRAWYTEKYEDLFTAVSKDYKYECNKITLYEVDMMFTFERTDGTSGLIKITDALAYMWEWEEK